QFSNSRLSGSFGGVKALPFGGGGPLAVGEVITSSVKKWLKTPLFATFPRGEGLAATPPVLPELHDKWQFVGQFS
ncbi:MAG: hypothetical protein J6Q30_02280, partial [Oscillospiraceae bacterium]|nr:hypothetical protein [Oscillospiraceae bacterium]